jgi:signal transduction histidine kinase
MINLFINIDPVLLTYFFYGAAFLILGMSIAAKDMKGSDLKLAGSLRLLVLFGFTHGIHEWLQLYPLIEGEHLSFQAILNLKLAAAALFVLSFVILLGFGLSLLRIVSPASTWLSRILPVLLAVLWIVYVLWEIDFSIDFRLARSASIGARYTFGFVGSILAAYGLTSYSHEIKDLSRTAARNLSYAGISFGFYAVFAGVFSSDFTLLRPPVPVEVLRGASAVFITYFIVKALNIFDIETRKKIEQQARRIVQAEKLTSLGQLAAGIAHEINNPLTNASLGIQMLKGRLSGDASVIGKLDAVEKNIDRAASIARELLQFSRQQEEEFMPVNINAVIRAALTLLEYKMKSVTVREELGPLPDVMGDPGKLEQVFINVLSNAVEAMPNGGRITIRTVFDGRNVRIGVEDTGPGMVEEHLSRVFDPFFTTKNVGAGTGLGLSICYGIVKHHKGSIEVTSAPGKGASVTIKIPGRGKHEENTDSR